MEHFIELLFNKIAENVGPEGEGIAVPFNGWNVVLCLQSCFADEDKHESLIKPEERDLAFQFYRKYKTCRLLVP